MEETTNGTVHWRGCRCDRVAILLRAPLRATCLSYTTAVVVARARKREPEQEQEQGTHDSSLVVIWLHLYSTESVSVRLLLRPSSSARCCCCCCSFPSSTVGCGGRCHPDSDDAHTDGEELVMDDS